MPFESARLIQGTGRFTEDLAREDALHFSVVRSDLPHALIERIDASVARALPGVHGIFIAEDLGRVPTIPIRVGTTPTLESRLQPVLARDRVRYVGEPIAIVVAETAAVAKDATDAVRVDLSALQVAGDLLQTSSACMWGDDQDNTLIEVPARYGPSEEIFKRAEAVLDFDFSTSRRAGLPIETRQLIAEWVDGELHMWGLTKFVRFTRQALADMFGIEPALIHPHRVHVGGMFGVRGEIYPEDYLVAWAAAVTGRMVRWHESRREHLLAANQAGEQYHKLQVALDNTGRFLGLRDQVMLDMGAYPRPIGSRIPHIIVETMPGPYYWEAVDIHCVGMATCRTPVGTIRGPAAFETAFVRERMIDAVARRLGVSPYELRRRNLIRPRSIPYRLPFEHPSDPVVYDSGDFPTQVDQFADLVDYDRLQRRRDERRASGRIVGLGWALSMVHSGLGRDETVSLTLNDEGVFVLSTSGVDVGQGFDTTMTRILADHLGIPTDVIEIASGDVAAPAPGNGTFSSRSTIFVGSATVDGASKMRRLASERAGQILHSPLSEISLTPSGAEAEGQSITWKELAPLTAVGSFQMEHPTFGLAVHLAEVAVEPETGEVRVERMWIGYDCGRAVDRRNVGDQLVGAAVAGISGAIYERLVFDEGIPIAGTLADYLLAHATDVPDTRALVFEFGSPGNPLGAKGAGEAGLIGAGAAVANAVADALGDAGDSISQLPIRPETVHRALSSISTSSAP